MSNNPRALPRLYSFSFAHDTASLNTGVTVYTPAVGDVLIEATWFVDEAWNGTTPLADIGRQDSATGLFQSWLGGGNAVDLSTLSLSDMQATSGTVSPYGGYVSGDPTSYGGASLHSIIQNYELDNGLSIDGEGVKTFSMYGYGAFHRFTGTTPLKLWVSQDGARGGTAIGGTTGEATLYLLIAHPISLNP